jgi:hypothetical protein
MSAALGDGLFARSRYLRRLQLRRRSGHVKAAMLAGLCLDFCTLRDGSFILTCGNVVFIFVEVKG